MAHLLFTGLLMQAAGIIGALLIVRYRVTMAWQLPLWFMGMATVGGIAASLIMRRLARRRGDWIAIDRDQVSFPRLGLLIPRESIQGIGVIRHVAQGNPRLLMGGLGRLNGALLGTLIIRFVQHDHEVSYDMVGDWGA
jgi:hypothetical protein